MNRQEYMSELKAALAGFDQNIATEIITDYEEHFDIGAAEGRTEEQICEELGSIQELISEIKQIENVNTQNPQPAGTNFIIVNNGITEETDKVDTADKEKNPDTSDKTETSTDKTNTENKMNTEAGTSNQSICRRVIVNAASADVNIRPSRDNNCNFDYENHGSANQMMAYKFECHQEGDTLYANVTRRTSGTNWFFNRIKEPHMELNIKLANGLELVTIRTEASDISVMDVSVGELDINTLSGDVKLHNANIQHLRHKAFNGDIELERISGESIDINSKSGDIKLFGLDNKRAGIETLSGDINMNNCYIESSNIRTASGDMELERCTLVYCDLKTTSGSAECKGIDSNALHTDTKSGNISVNVRAKEVEIKSLSGNIRAYVNGDTKLSLNSVSGNVNATLMNINGYSANVSTVSGGAQLYFGSETRKLRSGSVSFGNGVSEVYANTVSGSIRING